MRLRKGPRPGVIWLFAALLIIPSLFGFTTQLLAASQDARFADEAFRISTVSGLSAKLAIIVIPVLAIVVFASRIAKWLFAALSIVSIVLVANSVIQSGVAFSLPAKFYIQSLVTNLAFLLLFTPSARSWFDGSERQVADTFE